MAWSQNWGPSWGGAWGDGVGGGVTPSPNNSAWGSSWGDAWAGAWGAAGVIVDPPDPTGPFTPASVTVRAFRVMFFGGVIRDIGTTFQITSPYQFTPYGMVLVSTPPSDWTPLMEAYVETTDNNIIRMPGRDETRFPTRDGRVVTPEAGNPYD
jgi:hypothetical protein